MLGKRCLHSEDAQREAIEDAKKKIKDLTGTDIDIPNNAIELTIHKQYNSKMGSSVGAMVIVAGRFYLKRKKLVSLTEPVQADEYEKQTAEQTASSAEQQAASSAEQQAALSAEQQTASPAEQQVAQGAVTNVNDVVASIAAWVQGSRVQKRTDGHLGIQKGGLIVLFANGNVRFYNANTGRYTGQTIIYTDGNDLNTKKSTVITQIKTLSSQIGAYVKKQQTSAGQNQRQQNSRGPSTGTFTGTRPSARYGTVVRAR